MKPLSPFAVFLAVSAAAATLAAAATPARGQKPTRGMPRFAAAATATSALDTLTPGATIAGFRAVCVYTGDRNRRMGARFQHVRTGFVFDYLESETAPQAFIYVNTPPTSDKGEPHTQEHLLLGKGNKGRAVATAETLTLSDSSAYTEQWRTCYFFNTTAGAEAFYAQLQMRLDALLHPDYTDEEVRREVRNFGVSSAPDGALRLEEKGSVYNEMVSTMDKSGSQLYRALFADLYGPNHPLAYEAGGTPEALRTLTPAQIKQFRDRNYYLGNMGMQAAFPRKQTMGSILSRLNTLLNRLEPAPTARRPAVDIPAFPAPRPAPVGSLKIVAFPDRNPQQPGDIGFAWPVNRQIQSVEDYLLLGFFFDNLASDADTPLYKTFIDAKTRKIETGATGVYSWTPDEQGFPVYVGLSDVQTASLTEDSIRKIRALVVDEIARIASLPDGSPDLAAFNSLLKTRITAYRRAQSKFVNSPPGFGGRGTSDAWMSQTRLLQRSPGFAKSVLMTGELDRIEKRLDSKTNPWRGLLADWKITGVTPYAVGAKADPALVTQQETGRAVRIAAEIQRLANLYHTPDDQATIRRYKADYDRETARQNAIAALAKNSAKFLDKPPLTLDDTLPYRVTKLGNGIPLFAATFDTMTSATVRLNLPLKGLGYDSSDLVYLAALPALLTGTGVVVNNEPLTYEQMIEKQRGEILSLSASFDTNPETGRYELAVTGAGNTPDEAKRAIGWMKTILTSPNWTPENLPRLCDVVNQSLPGLRNRMLQQEEYWCQSVATSWRFQREPVALVTGCFMTQAHQLQRLRWMLMPHQNDNDNSAFLAFLPTLAKATGSRDERAALLTAIKNDQPESIATALSPGAKTLAKEAASDLEANLAALPDSSLSGDWKYLCDEIGRDFQQHNGETLNNLHALRARLLSRYREARVTVAGSAATQAALAVPLEMLFTATALAGAPGQGYRSTNGPVSPGYEASGPTHPPADTPTIPLVTQRVRQRLSDPSAELVFAGLVAPSMKGGVVMNSARLAASYKNADTDSLLRLLAANLYGGGGADSVFMKTWGAGLAYGNGIGTNVATGRVSYYADHTPILAQTVRFVVDTVKAPPPTAPDALVEYALANVFMSRGASGYEARAWAQANDIADGSTPEVVAAFRKKLLAVRTRPDLAKAVWARLPDVMRPLLPGYGGQIAKEKPGEDPAFLVIGPEKQLAAYEAYLKGIYSAPTSFNDVESSREKGDRFHLFRLYPRDFWLTER